MRPLRGLGVGIALCVGLAGAGCASDDNPASPDANVVQPQAGSGGTTDVAPSTDVPGATPGSVRLTLPPGGLTTTEKGGTAMFGVALSRMPTADVVVPISSNNIAEGTAAPSSLRFTSANWASPQLITVTGVDDALRDGDVRYKVLLGVIDSTDTGYQGVDPDDVDVTNSDDETPKLVVALAGINPTARTSEAGGETRVRVSLNGQPSAAVTVPVVSSDATEGAVTPATLTFTPANWNAPQEILVAGVDDAEGDGDQAYKVTVGPTTSTDTNFNALAAVAVDFTNIDNESAGVTVSAPVPLATTEAGGKATFTIVLNKKPTANVSIGVSSDTPTEATVAPAAVTFTPNNWNAPQTVTVTGVDDDAADGPRLYKVLTAAAVSTDTEYSGINAADVPLANTDNDSPGLTISPNSMLTTTEAGGQATFTVALNSQPTADVVVRVSSNDQTEGTANATLTFTMVNWKAPQTVTITGVNDDEADGSQLYMVTGTVTSTDLGYNGLAFGSVSLMNTDNDSPGVTISPVEGVSVTEAGGTGTFSVVLNSKPSASVVIALSSSDVGEGTVAPAALTFTTNNWNAPQTVTVTGVDDQVADGNQPFSIVTAPATSTDVGYSGLDAVNVSVTNTDNDSPGITVSPTSGLVTTEAGGTASFLVVLNSQPTADVTIPVSSLVPTEATVGPATLTFTQTNWNQPQSVLARGVDDFGADGNQTFTIVLGTAVSGDTGYSGLDPADVTGSNTDNDSPGITVTPTAGLVTTEIGGTASFSIRLNSQPSAPVTIALTSSDTTEGTVSPASVTFTAANWSVPYAVTVTGVNDAVDDGNQVFSVVTAAAVSTDPGYSGLDASDVGVSNTDDETSAILVSPTSGLVTTEAGATATFTVVLSSQPTADVVIPLTSSDTTEGTVSPGMLTFTASNWNMAQTVTITGQPDAMDDGDISYSVVTAAAVSADTSGYSGMNAADVSVSNTDDDTHGVTVSTISGNTTEAGGTATFTVVLTSQPTADVTVNLSSSNTNEGTVGSSITFTSGNWNMAQTVTVTGVDDYYDDGDTAYNIVTAAIYSADTTGYNAYNPGDVSVTNVDNDAHGVTVSSISGNTTEAGGTATFTVVLTSRPNADVTISFTSSNTAEGTVLPASVTFMAASSTDWSMARTITVTGVNDDYDDGDVGYTITTAAISSSDTTGYNTYNPNDVSVTNTDNDTVGVTVGSISGNTTEAGGGATFTVVLNSRPTADVTISFTSSDTAEGTVSPGSVTFTAASSTDWSVARTITVSGVNDDYDDGDKGYTITTAAISSSDTTGYNTYNPADVSVTNTDNDTAGATVSSVTGSPTEAGGTGTFTVVLTSRPTADVTINFTSSNTAEATVTASATFTAASSTSWSTPQTITITGVDDAYDDGDQAVTITTAVIVSSDTTGYSGYNPADVMVTNTDDDAVGFAILESGGSTATTEAGGTDSFTVALTSRPTADVTIAVSSSNTMEGTVSPGSLTFTSSDWNMPQTVTVTGVDDMIVDGTVSYTIVLGAASSTDLTYNTQDPSDVSATNSPIILMFSAGTFGGNLTNRATVDASCTSTAGTTYAAQTAGRSVRALISMSGTDQMLDMPTNYNVPSAAPIKNIGSTTTIAGNWAQLMTGTLDNSLFSAGVLPSGVFFWTGTLNTGVYDSSNNCSGWTSTAGGTSGRAGYSNSLGDFWKSAGIAACSIPRYLLCIAY